MFKNNTNMFFFFIEMLTRIDMRHNFLIISHFPCFKIGIRYQIVGTYYRYIFYIFKIENSYTQRAL